MARLRYCLWIEDADAAEALDRTIDWRAHWNACEKVSSISKDATQRSRRKQARTTSDSPRSTARQ